jgi:hypothetical protein
MKKILLTLAVVVAALCSQQLAAQTQINQANISSFPYYITKPGSYILTSNLTTSGSNVAIWITASNVNLNLNGNTISGSSVCTASGCTLNSNNFGIYTSSSLGNVEIFNGSLTGFTTAVYANGGIIHDLMVTSCSNGINVNYATVHHNYVMNCAQVAIADELGTVSENTVLEYGSIGIQSYYGSVLNNTISNGVIGLYQVSGYSSGNTMFFNSIDIETYGNPVYANNACTSGAC